MLKPTCKLRFIKRSVKEIGRETPLEIRVLQQFWEETINIGWADVSVHETGVWRDVELVDDAEQA